ncbi:histidine phosphatase family protein [Leptospira langatensis]|uniref:Histidine phosphatase family protein n=1 Tax=Leptospira langatensis TaxID=2484983 RepID=A0A5F1ZYL4_9LEPT|nr:histidine phosphatase family protein [Leptospira langatensis]TGJ98425.1 histidine phosphatase family protein [Leptospira langatensis]TGL43340.1 histidine phosphatase family protein [Leptospira langatensis]
MKKSLCLLRHASIDRVYQGHYIGQKDVSLSSEGLLEIERVRKELPSQFLGGKIFLSPAKQCLETLASLQIDRDPSLEYKDELKEFDFGDWEGYSFRELGTGHLAELTEWANFAPGFRFPNGESIGEIISRAEKFKDIVLSSKHKNILILSHGGILSLLLCLLLGMPASFYLKFRILPSTIVFLEVYQNGEASMVKIVPSNLQRRCEWPG